MPARGGKGLRFGVHEVPLEIKEDGVHISVEEVEDGLVYRRETPDEKVEKLILSKERTLLLTPVEPLNKPKALTPYLLVEFERPILLEPKATKKVYVKSPMEVGAFISLDGEFENLDVFTLVKNKFTIYGPVRGGVICKYWRSSVHLSIPETDPIREGVIGIALINMANCPVEVGRAVFNAYGMKVYFGEGLVSMKANMEIMSAEIAETDFVDSPLEKGMEKALELYVSRKLAVGAAKFVMEGGM